VRGGASDPSFQKRGRDTSKAGISTREELLDLEELTDLYREFGPAPIWKTPIVRCSTPIDSESTPWGNLRGDPWFGTTLAEYL
jgi:hypothetical protein